jgi:PAS domain S-box-containing protein
MKKETKKKDRHLLQIEKLRLRLEEAEETLRAIREGQIDALVVSGPQGNQVYTLKSAEQPYRVFIETMNEGAVTLGVDGTILYCNSRFAEMLEIPSDKLIGTSIFGFIPSTDRSGFESAFEGGKQQVTMVETSLKRDGQELIPVHLSFNMLHGLDMPVVCMVAMDLIEQKRLEQALRQLNADLEKRVQDRTAKIEKTNETLRAEIVERKRAVEALEESQTLLRSVTETIPDPIFLKDRQSRIMLANPATLRAIGKPIEEVMGKDDRQHYEDPAVGEAIIANDRRIMESGQTEVIEEIGQSPEGYRIFLSTKTPYRNANGEIIGILGIARDITDRKKAEIELRESEERWATTLASIGDAVIATCEEGRIRFMNAVAEELTGWTLSEASQKPAKQVFKIINEETRLEVEDPVAKVIETGMICGLANHTVLIRKDGTEVPIDDSGAPIKDKEGRVLGVVLAFRDITERKRAEEELQLAYARLSTLFDHRIDGIGIIIANTEGGILEANDYFLKMLGFRREELKAGKLRWSEMTPPEWTGIDEIALAQLRERGFCDSQEKEYLRRDGTRVPVFITGAMLPGQEGRVLALVLDITERKRAEEVLRKAHAELEKRVQERTSELTRANTELNEEIAKRERAEQQLLQAQKLESMGVLTGGIAHDFNNILGPIIINSEMALSDLPEGPGIRSNLELILASSLRGRDLVRQMLLFSRKSEKKQEIITLSPVIKETFKLLRSSVPTTIQMELQLKTESDTVYADPSQIQQVLMNLCTNAAYAMRGTTGSINISLDHISFGPTDLPEPNIQPGDYLVLSVKDTGVGMDEMVRSRVFEPFFTTKPVEEGTGLGLSVVYGIVKSHRGSITVYSEPGRGSVFRVYLPKHETGILKKAETLKPVPRGNERILFVDDEEPIVNSVRNMLQKLGYKVTALTDSREALTLFSADPSQFDLVMTDQTMPHMTGEDLGRETMRIRPGIPVILCTGYSDLISSEKATAMGFQGFIMKPFTVGEGAELVRRVLDHKGSSDK